MVGRIPCGQQQPERQPIERRFSVLIPERSRFVEHRLYGVVQATAPVATLTRTMAGESVAGGGANTAGNRPNVMNYGVRQTPVFVAADGL